ncbi:MAG TPA: hypothetical protein ENJ08_07965 [Gammaproteobacteria bacterium]|nr:hypothetical protein [Gammaproteobacteria bacterium]
MTESGKFKFFGISGILIGILGLTLAIFQADLNAAFAPPQAADPSLKELAIDAGKQLIQERLLGKKEETPPDKLITNTHNWVQIIYMAIGVIAVLLGIISWVNKEHIRVSSAAVSLGLIVAAWQYTVIAIIIAVIILLIINLAE